MTSHAYCVCWKMFAFTRLVALATTTTVDNTETVVLDRLSVCCHRSIVVALERTNWSADRQGRVSRTRPNVNENKRNNNQDKHTDTSNDSSRCIVGKEAGRSITIADTAPVQNARAKRNAVAIQAGLVKRRIVRKKAETALVDHAQAERLASAIKARGTVTVAHAAAVKLYEQSESV